MSLLKWKELAKSKTELGNKINYAHHLIKRHKIGQETSQESFSKEFRPVTSKLDELIDDDENSGMPQRRKRPLRKMEVPDYGIDIEDEVEDMNIGDLFGDDVPPQQEKQIVPKPPTYEEALEEIVKEPAPEYDYNETIDYGIPDEEMTFEILKDSGLDDYKAMDEEIDNPEMTFEKKMEYLDDNIKHAKKEKQRLNGSRLAAQNKYKKNKNEAQFNERMKGIEKARRVLNEYIDIIEEQKKDIKYKGKGIKGRGIMKKAEKERNKIKGYKLKHTSQKKYNSGAISEAKKQTMNKRLDNEMAALNEYIKDHKKNLELEKKIRRKQRGGNVMFFNDVNQLLKKLELIIGEVLAGNTSIKMRNMGVNILDTLLRMSTINRPQYNKLYNQYFKVKFM